MIKHFCAYLLVTSCIVINSKAQAVSRVLAKTVLLRTQIPRQTTENPLSGSSHEWVASNGDSIAMAFYYSRKNRNPIFVINGKIREDKFVKAISPQSILDVKVLKGDDAFAQYGAKGSNGVIIITTKKKHWLRRQ